MKPGPKRTPQKLAELRGFPGKRRVNAREPKPSASTVTCPAWLDDVAKAEWARVGPELVRLELLTVLDVAALAAYCTWFARWRRAEEALRTLGTDVQATPNGYLQPHAQLAIARGAVEMMNRFGAQFGLSPTSRADLQVEDRGPGTADKATRRPAAGDEFESFLRRNRST